MTDLVPVGDWADVEGRVKQNLEEMGPLKQSFIDATVEHLGSWAWKETERVIELEPARVVKLGKRRLKRLRRRVRKIEKKLPKIVAKRIGKKEFWAHQSSAPEVMLNIKGGAGFKNPYRPTRDPIPRLLSDAFGLVMTRVGRVHRRSKLGKARWRKSKTVSGMFDYRGTFEPSEEMTDSLASYADAADELRAALQELDDQKADTLQQRAEGLWQGGA